MWAENRDNVVVAVPRHFLPYYHVHADENPSGFAIDVMEAVATLAGLRVRYLVRDDWQSVTEALASGEADIIPNIGISQERAALFDFTDAYEVFNLGLFVRAGKNDIQAARDLSGRKVAVVRFNIGSQYAEEFLSTSRVSIHNSDDEALFGLLAGEVDACIYPEPVMWQLAHAIGVENRIKLVGMPLLEIKRAMAVRKGNAELRTRLNKAVAELLESREYKNIYIKWYGVRQRGESRGIVLYLFGLLIVVCAIVAALWRYRRIITLNGELASAVEKQEKTAIRLRQAMFTLEKVGEAVFWIELSGRFFYVNEAAMQRLGYAWHELTQMSVWDIDPDYTKEIWPEFIDYLQIGESMTFQTRHRSKNGKIFPVEIKSQYLVYEKKMFICAFAQDITERLAAEKSLAESELRQRAILENVADSIVTIDQMGIIESFNPAAERAFGYRASEVIGENVSILMPEPECICHDQYLGRYLAGESRKRLCGGPRETVAKRKDNSIFPIDLSVSEMMLDGKRIFIGVILDISDRKESEEKIIRQKSELEAVRQAEDLKSKFLAIVSHELRTPLTPIIGFAEKIIKKQPSSEKVTLFAEHICQNAKHLQEIINDLLDFSRIESGRMPLDVKPVAISTVFDQLRSSINHLVETKNLRLKLEIHTEISMVTVDVLRVKQILFNLVSNAVKFTPAGGQITISARMDGEMVLIMVRDTGHGISAIDQLVIFDHFVQVQRQQNEQQGTGLGLAIAKKLVELHGGKIWVESAPGQGTAFFFTLPTKGEVAHG